MDDIHLVEAIPLVGVLACVERLILNTTVVGSLHDHCWLDILGFRISVVRAVDIASIPPVTRRLPFGDAR